MRIKIAMMVLPTWALWVLESALEGEDWWTKEIMGEDCTGVIRVQEAVRVELMRRARKEVGRAS